MPKKLLIGLVIVICSISGAAGYVALQTGGATPVLKTNTSNLVPEAALEINSNTSSSAKREICSACDGTGWSKQVPCPKCGGSGVLECTVCNGTGEYVNGTICSYCQGTG